MTSSHLFFSYFSLIRNHIQAFVFIHGARAAGEALISTTVDLDLFVLLIAELTLGALHKASINLFL